MKTGEQHTPTPWVIDDGMGNDIVIANDLNVDVAVVKGMANAEFIVRVVNQYRDGDVERAEAQIAHLKRINTGLLEAIEFAASYIRQVEGDSFILETIEKSIVESKGGK